VDGKADRQKKNNQHHPNENWTEQNDWKASHKT
jgi:hypothetical protein